MALCLISLAQPALAAPEQDALLGQLFDARPQSRVPALAYAPSLSPSAGAAPEAASPPKKHRRKAKPKQHADAPAFDELPDEMQDSALSGDDVMAEMPMQMPFPAAAIAIPLNTPATIPVERAIVMALRNSPERDIAASQVTQARYAVDEARANYFPQVNLRAENGREYNDPFAVRLGATTYNGYNYGSSTGINMRQMLFDGFSTRETVKQRLQLLESAHLSRDKVSEELITFTVQVYMDLRRLQQVAAASADNLTALTDIGALINKRVEAGDASKVEQNYIQARLAAAQKEHLSTLAALKDAFSALTYLIGDVRDFEAQLPDLSAYRLLDSDELMHRAVMQNTDMRLLDSDRKAAVHDLNAAKSKFYPTVDFIVDANHADDLGGFTGVHRAATAKVQVNYKLLDGGLRSATTNRQYAKLTELENKMARLKREIRQNVRKAFNKRETAHQELDVVEEEIRANSELEKLYRKQFEQGELEFIQLVESQERIFAAQMKKIQLESDLVNVTFDLMRATSDLLPKFCGEAGVC